MCVCVCVCSSEFMDETLLSMGVYLVNSAHTQLYVSLVQTVCVGGGGALTWYFTSFIYMKVFSSVLPSLVSLKFSINSAVSLLYGVGVLHDEFMLKCRFERKKMH